jgi:hypothetical protein
MKNTYKLERHNDQTWVNLEPLMADIQTNYDSLHDMDITQFTQKEIELLELKQVGLQQVYQFLGALVMESKLGEIREQRKIEAEIAKATQQMQAALK